MSQAGSGHRTGVTVSFALPAPALRRYVTAYYLTEVAPDCAPFVEDYLHPEWGNVRFGDGVPLIGAVGGAPLAETPARSPRARPAMPPASAFSRGDTGASGFFPSAGRGSSMHAPASGPMACTTSARTMRSPPSGH